MPTIDFDFGKFCDSQWYGYPKNGNWSKYPQFASEVVSSNHDSWDKDVTDARVAHGFRGYKSDQWLDLAGDCGNDTWYDHLQDVVDSA